MKFLRKINKGLVLTIIVLLILSIYLINVETKRNKEKPEIEKVCSDYIELINKYATIPQETQKIYAEVQSANGETEKVKEDLKKSIETNMNKFEEELKTKMIDSDIAVSMQKEVLEKYLEGNNDPFSTIITKFDKEITKIRKFEFDENQVTVTFDAKIDLETKYLGNDLEETTKKDTYTTSFETITLKKVDNNWKVVYADLIYYGGNIKGAMGTVTVDLH